jgi:hypothetical protein
MNTLFVWLSTTNQQYFSLIPNQGQPSANQQYFSLITKSASVTNQLNKVFFCGRGGLSMA